MIVQFTSELRKFTSTRTWWLMLLGMVLYSAGFTAFLSYAPFLTSRSPVDLTTPESAVIAYNIAPAIAYVFPLAVGVIVTTHEYRYRTISQTLLAEPHRPTVFAAKLLAGFCTAFVFGAASVGACVLVVVGVLSSQGQDTHLFSPVILTAIAGSVAVLTLWGLVGVGVGALIRNQTVAVVGLVVLTQFVEPMARTALAGVGPQWLTLVFPGIAGDVAAGGTAYNAMTGTAVASQGSGFLVLAVYALVFSVLGSLRFSRYEVA
ncbi:ABC transporter permease [Nocardiopsis sp. NPDC050513]|uniref:ABC transporter permease n=1 Tax=Nocardiopsis sp. NPDC050513 TaxID=3364338 RepID=UPI0037AA139B